MSGPLRRYEVFLPLRHNDGRPVPPELVADAVLALEERFGAASCEPNSIQGAWRHEGTRYQDELTRVFVDVADTPDNREFFTAFKERLKRDFAQVDIWLTTYPIEVI